MSLAAHMLGEDALRVTGDGFEVAVHLSWYRSLPLSSVEEVELAVDGEAVARDEIAFAVNGAEHAIDALAGRWDEIWFVLDPALLRVRRPLVRRGDRVELRVRLSNRIPYIMVGPGIPLRVATERSRTVVAR